MITSLKNWRQRLFANAAIIGVAFDENRVCAVQVRLQNDEMIVGPWAQIHYENPALAEAMQILLEQKKFLTSNVAGVVSNALIDGIYLNAPPNSTDKEWSRIAASELANSAYPDLSRIAIAVVGEGQMVLTCENHYIKNYEEAIAATNKQLIALDWQPLTSIRIFYSVLLGAIQYPSLRNAILAVINQLDMIQVEAVGAAINGLNYVEY